MLVSMNRYREGPWQAEVPIAFGAFTLHAIGWRLHDLKIGNAGLVWAPTVDLLLAAPVRFVVRGGVAMLITAEMTGGEHLPYVVLEGLANVPQRISRPISFSVNLDDE